MSSALQTLPSEAEQTTEIRERLATISGQSSVFFFGTIFTACAGYLFKVYLARVLGAEALGIYALGMTVAGLAGIVAALGLPQTAARFVAVYKATGDSANLARFLWHGAALLIIANALVGAVILAFRQGIATRIYHVPALAAALPFFVLIMALGALTAFFGQCLGGYKSVAERTIIASILGTCATIAFSVLLLQLGLGLYGYLAAQAASAALVLLLLGWSVRKFTPKSARHMPHSLPRLPREVTFFSATLFGIQGLEFVGAQADRIVIGIYLSAREVGIYSIAATLVAFIPILLQSVNQMFAPSIAEVHALGQREILLRLYRTLTKWILGATFPLALVVMFFASPLMAIFGSEFTVGSTVLIIGCLGQLVNCAVGSVGQLLVMSGNQLRMARTQALVVPVSVFLSVLLVPRYGIAGAAAATAAGTAAMNLLWLRDVKVSLDVYPLVRMYTSLAPAVLASLLSILGVRYLLRDMHLPALAIGAALISGYAVFAVCSAFLGFDEDDRALARQAYLRIRNLALWRSHELKGGCVR
jgi:O-antigen/teichoic acid export membrane protein